MKRGRPFYAASNPVTVSHSDLQPKVQEARKAYHQRLIDRFDADLPWTVKKFWFVASMCDPRFKKLVFEGDNMLKPAARREAVKWFSEEYNTKYKGKFAAAAPPARHLHRRAMVPRPSRAAQRRRGVT